ncbi:winged helix-turn-helix domain-containing protein [Kordiimonas pumila]|uniref:Winged helix-turn-helix domain-containing protein n=1 Tax=Kordiimonas pumila TaxID=2161677 RepID=A0ABV7D0T8_9PROT|nr:winged helix-turn-helix domain-containing protein [Kordiimonas pumila]
MSTANKHYSLKLRIMAGDDIAFGPGKAELLSQIQKTGSIAAAGRAMGMSYKRAWLLVETMNNCFTSPLVEKQKGGATKGGATVTALGETVLNYFRDMQHSAAQAVAEKANAFPGLASKQPAHK